MKGVSVHAYLGQRSTGEIKVCEAVIIVKSSQEKKNIRRHMNLGQPSTHSESSLPTREDWLFRIVAKGMAFGCL